MHSCNLFATPPQLYFRYEQDHCPHCHAPLKVYRSKTRQRVYTLHIGRFIAHETIMQCKRCPNRPRFTSGELAALLAPGCNFGHDVMVFVGEQLFRRHHSVEHTVAALLERNVEISEGEVRELAARFVVCLGLAHVQATPVLKQHLAMQGGYILHLDSTSRVDSMKLLSGIDELSGLVLLNVKLANETGAHVANFLQQIVARFGPPLAIACDMAAALRAGINEVLRGVPVFICHFHFLRDCGKDLMQADYRELARRLDTHQIKSKLKTLAQQIEPHLEAEAQWAEKLLTELDDGAAQLPTELSVEQHTALLALQCLSALHSAQQGDGLGFPFDLSTLRFYEQIIQVRHAVVEMRHCCELSAEQKRFYQRSCRLLDSVANDRKLAQLALRLQHHESIFLRLREAMRLGQPAQTVGLNDPGDDVDIEQLEQAMRQLKVELNAEPDAEKTPEVVKLIEQIERHWHGLFRAPIELLGPDGNKILIKPQRTNNIMEQFFRRLGHHERRRTGTNLSASRLNGMLPDTPLAVNLDNPAYVQILLDGCATLAERFSRLDHALVRRSLQAARKATKLFDKPRQVRAILIKRRTPVMLALYALRAHLQKLQATG